MDVDVDSNFE